MNQSAILLFPIWFPAAAGLLLLVLPALRRTAAVSLYTGAALALTAASVVLVSLRGEISFPLFSLTGRLPIVFRQDSVGRLFGLTASVGWVLSGIFAFSYLKKEKENRRFFGFYLLAYAAVNALAYAGNLITFYFFYELMTLLSLPLVLHERTKEAVLAGLKYLFYSLFGAYLALFGLFFVYRFANTLTFTAKGVLDMSLAEGNRGILLTAAFCMALGFSVKAGMFPFHSWLPTAHPVAPAPASAVLSGLIVKCGVLGIIRVVYYVFGADYLRGTWVQTVLLSLSLVTVFMGSMLAWLEDGLKKRLAWSTVSQVSYILFGLFLLDPTALTGSLMHTVFHAFIKSGLFLCAGAFIVRTGKRRAGELRGIGRRMPVTLWCFTLCALALIGIPPASGFLSKWYLCVGALHTKLPVFSWLGPAVLLVSALLTAGYLLPVTARGFFPGEGEADEKASGEEADRLMLVPMLVLAALAVLLGMFAGPLIRSFSALAGQLI